MSDQSQGQQWKTGLDRIRSIATPSIIKSRPKTMLTATRRSVQNSNEDEDSRKDSLQTSTSRVEKYNSFIVSHLAFDAHFSRKSRAMHLFEEKQWNNQERIHRWQKNHERELAERKPPIKVVDSFATEDILENRKEERRRKNMRDDAPLSRSLPRDGNINYADRERKRIYFWG